MEKQCLRGHMTWTALGCNFKMPVCDLLAFNIREYRAVQRLVGWRRIKILKVKCLLVLVYLPEVHNVVWGRVVDSAEEIRVFRYHTFLVLSEGNKSKKFRNTHAIETSTICCGNQFIFCACGRYTDFTQIGFVSHAVLTLHVPSILYLFIPICDMRVELFAVVCSLKHARDPRSY